MSEAGTPAPEAEKTLIEQSGDVPETVIPAEPVVDAPIEEEAPEAPAEAPIEAKAAKRTPWYQVRLNQMAEQRDHEKAARIALEAKLAEIAPPEGGEAAAIKPEALQPLIEQRARAIVQAEKARDRNQGFLTAGVKEFGQEDFTEKCNMVASMGAGDSAEFMQIITDPDIVPDGHKVVAALADNPDEAQRILSLEPMKMAGALARFASTSAPKPAAPLSKAPAPIKTVGGSAKAATPDDNEPYPVWLAKRNATARTTPGGKPNTH